ncbi:MAG: DNA polymerase-1, partial [Kiritimatiellia bacterium]
AGEPTFRHKLDATYKANRGAPPDDLLPQFALSRRAVAALGIRCLMVPGYEADDLMATLVERMPSVDRVVVSQDKDLIQLLTTGVWIRDDKSLALTDARAAEDKHGVPPSQWTTYQALCGDSVDNIPGVRGVGAKTAAALVSGLGDLDSIYGSLHKVADLPIRGARTLAKKLEAGRDDAYRSLTLATLHRDVPDASMLLQPDDLIWRGPSDQGHVIYDELGFHRPLNRARVTANAMR